MCLYSAWAVAYEEKPQFGIWIWHIDQLEEWNQSLRDLNIPKSPNPGENPNLFDQVARHAHELIADRLQKIGTKRAFIKVADGNCSCPCPKLRALCQDLPQVYKDRGIEPFAWAFAYPQSHKDGNIQEQVQPLRTALQNGFSGFVIDVENTFNLRRYPDSYENLMRSYSEAREEAEKSLQKKLPLWATTFAVLQYWSMDIRVIDRYVDAFLPQVYLENIGGLNEPEMAISCAIRQYNDRGVTKPIYPVLGLERGRVNYEQLDRMLSVSGPNASIWRIPDHKQYWPRRAKIQSVIQKEQFWNFFAEPLPREMPLFSKMEFRELPICPHSEWPLAWLKERREANNAAAAQAAAAVRAAQAARNAVAAKSVKQPAKRAQAARVKKPEKPAKAPRSKRVRPRR